MRRSSRSGPATFPYEPTQVWALDPSTHTWRQLSDSVPEGQVVVGDVLLAWGEENGPSVKTIGLAYRAGHLVLRLKTSSSERVNSKMTGWRHANGTRSAGVSLRCIEASIHVRRGQSSCSSLASCGSGSGFASVDHAVDDTSPVDDTGAVEHIREQ